MDKRVSNASLQVFHRNTENQQVTQAILPSVSEITSSDPVRDCASTTDATVKLSEPQQCFPDSNCTYVQTITSLKQLTNKVRTPVQPVLCSNTDTAAIHVGTHFTQEKLRAFAPQMLSSPYQSAAARQPGSRQQHPAAVPTLRRGRGTAKGIPSTAPSHQRTATTPPKATHPSAGSALPGRRGVSFMDKKNKCERSDARMRPQRGCEAHEGG